MSRKTINKKELAELINLTKQLNRANKSAEAAIDAGLAAAKSTRRTQTNLSTLPKSKKI